ncbi:MAG TPA: ABC transporter substrate-binding protein [Erysipelotrichaceae bacterium]|nr:ABC transporter substrate-binding protein [Erysipelotrichaceae bacterium]
MKKVKLLALALLSMTPMLVTSCQKNGIKTIGICQLVTHPALDAATEGFMEAVKEGMGEENVRFDFQDAAGEPTNCITIANSFVSKKVDLIMANATPALQAVANSTLTIPILGTSITEYGTALSLKNFNGTVGSNISGTSDLAPLDGQVDMIVELFPEAQKVGLLYCSAEANSKYQVNTVKSLLQNKSITTKEISFADSNDLQSVLIANVNDLDVLYIPTDNTCASNTTIIDAVCRPKRLPIICGEENICKGCGVASLSINYFNIGLKTGEMAVEILKEGRDISKMPIAYDENPVKKYNRTLCEELDIVIPSTYVEIE